MDFQQKVYYKEMIKIMSSGKKINLINDIFIFLFIVIIPLVYTIKTPDHYVIIRFTFLTIFLLLFTFFYLYKSLKNDKIILNRFSLLFFLSLFIFTALSGIGLINTANLTDGLLSLSKNVLLLSLTILLYLNFKDPGVFINKLTKGFTILASVIIILGFYQIIELYVSRGITHSNLYEIKASFGHKNIFSQVLLLCLPFSFYSFLQQKNIWKWLGILNIIFILFLLTILMTRSVWIAGALSFIITSTIGIITLNPNYFNFKRISLISVSVIVLISATIILYSKFDKSNALKKQLTQIFNLKYGSPKDRIMLWEKSLELAKEKPILGHGTGSWKVNILKYGNQNLKSEDNLTFYQRPHNDFIWILCEQGILSVVIYLLIFILCIYQSILLLKSKIEKNKKVFVLLMIFALASYLTFSFFSFPKDRVEFIIFLAFMFSSILLLSKNTKQKKPKISLPTKPYILILLPILVVISLYALSRLYSEIHLNKSYQARVNNDWELLIDEINKSQSAIFKIDPYSTPLSWYKGLAYFNLGKYSQATINFSNALEINPYNIHVLNNLATCKGIKGEYNSALQLYKQALLIAPNFEDVLYNICGIYHKLNDIENAILYLQKINNPKNINRYNKIITILIKQKLNILLTTILEQKVKNYTNLVLENDLLILELYHTSVQNGNSIKTQLFLNTQHYN